MTLCTLEITQNECPVCGVTYFLTVGNDSRLRATGNTFFCPNGHGLSYKDTEVSRLRETVKLDQQVITALREENIALNRQLSEDTKPRKPKGKKEKP